MASGFARPEGIAPWKKQHPDLDYRPLGRTGLDVSAAGFGSYRIDPSTPAHGEALAAALNGGINLIDTSANYGYGQAEVVIGAVLRHLFAAGDLKREAVVLVSKVGFLHPEEEKFHLEQGRTFQEVVALGEQLHYCLHPDFVRDQLTYSLNRLGCDCLDGYLLHNPESLLQAAIKQGTPIEEARAVTYGRIRAAFALLEDEVAGGRIRSYGVSSNTLSRPSDQPRFLSLAELWDIAESLGSDHHFRIVQFPMNLMERFPLFERNLPGGKSLLEFCLEKQLGVLINRPLNASVQGRTFRLAEPESFLADSDPNFALFRSQLQTFKSLVQAADADWRDVASLSQAALRALRTTAGIDTVLMGMRKAGYVAEVLHELRQAVARRDRTVAWRELGG